MSYKWSITKRPPGLYGGANGSIIIVQEMRKYRNNKEEEVVGGIALTREEFMSLMKEGQSILSLQDILECPPRFIPEPEVEVKGGMVVISQRPIGELSFPLTKLPEFRQLLNKMQEKVKEVENV